MTPEDLEQRLGDYGQTLEGCLEATSSGTPDVPVGEREPRRWMSPTIEIAAVAAVMLAVVGVDWWGDDSDQRVLVTAASEESAAPQDSLTVRQCRESYETLRRDLEERGDYIGPGIDDPTIQDGPAVTLSTTVRPGVTTVILRGEDLFVSCTIPGEDPANPLLVNGVGHVGAEPSTAGVEWWGGDGGIGLTNRGVTLQFFGRVGQDVRDLTLIAGPERSPAVSVEGWFLAEVALDGTDESIEQFVLEWTIPDGSTDRLVLLTYHENLREFLPPIPDSEPASVRTPEPASQDGVAFPACTAQGDDNTELPTEADIVARFRSGDTELSSVDDIARYSCIYAPGATLTQGGSTGDLAQTWAASIRNGPFSVSVPHRVIIFNTTPSEFDAALIVRAEGYRPPIAHFELIGPNWLITAQQNLPACDLLPAEVHQIQPVPGCPPR